MSKPMDSHTDYGPFATVFVFLAGLVVAAFRYLVGLGHRLKSLEDWRDAKQKQDSEMHALLQATHETATETKGMVAVLLSKK